MGIDRIGMITLEDIGQASNETTIDRRSRDVDLSYWTGVNATSITASLGDRKGQSRVPTTESDMQKYQMNPNIPFLRVDQNQVSEGG